jgi:hypothetical protein
MPAEVAGDGVEVITHGLSRLRDVPARDGLDDAPVLKHGALAILRPRQERAGEQHRGVQPLDELPHGTVAGCGHQRAVKRDVGLVEALLHRGARRTLGGLGHPHERRRQLLDVAVAGPRGCDARGVDLKDTPTLQVLSEHVAPVGALKRSGQDIGVEDIPVGGFVDGSAPAVLDRDQPALLHRADRLARHPSADIKLRREVDLPRQHVAGRPYARHDVGDQERHHVAVLARHRMIASHPRPYDESASCESCGRGGSWGP